MRGRLFSLRSRLMALVLLAFIPAFGLILHSGFEARYHAALDAQANALRLARLVAKDEEGLIEGADQLLTALARLPAVRAQDAAACNDLFADLKAQSLRYANFVAVTPDPEGGSVTVRAFLQTDDRQAQRRSDPPSPVIITVADQGIGIPRDKLSSIFGRFYQVDGSSTRHYGGLGIGLALCKAIVEAHGGRIWADSAGEGQGSTFYVALPYLAGST